MKVNAFTKFPFPFEVYVPVLNGTTTTYVKVRDDKAIIQRSNSGGINLFSRKPMAIGSVVRNLCDVDGLNLQDVDGTQYDLYVQTSEPDFNIFGQTVAWKHSLKRTMPKDFAALLAKAARV